MLLDYTVDYSLFLAKNEKIVGSEWMGDVFTSDSFTNTTTTVYVYGGLSQNLINRVRVQIKRPWWKLVKYQYRWMEKSINIVNGKIIGVTHIK